MSVVDELVVKLGLDAKEFQKGSKAVNAQLGQVKDAADKSGAAVVAGAKKAGDAYGKLKSTLVSLTAVLAIGITAFRAFNKIMAGGANLSRLARNLGESVDTLHRWGQAAKQSGGSAEGFAGTVKGISEAITELQVTGQSGLTKWLGALGVSLVDVNGKAKKSTDLLLDIGEAVTQKVGNRADQMNILKMMGIDEGTANILLKGRKEAENLLSQQTGYSDEAAKKAETQEQKWLATQEKINEKFRELAYKFLPTIERLTDTIAKSMETIGPIVVAIAGAFATINDETNGWLGTILLAVAALKIAKGLLPAAVAGGAAAGGAGAAAAGGGAAAAAKGWLLSKMAKFGVGGALLTYSGETNKGEQEELERRRSMGATIDTPSAGSTLAEKIAAQEKKAGLPPGLLQSVMRQEIGNRQEFVNDPSKYHYEPNAEGKRKSSAFGPFGLLDSTIKQPGYGVAPLTDKTSLDEQIRFAAQYLAARIKYSGGNVEKGLAGYGEGSKYAAQVLGRMGAANPVLINSSAAGAGRGTAGPTNISIGDVNIQTAATDARGIAQDVRRELIMQFNTGMR